MNRLVILNRRISTEHTPVQDKVGAAGIAHVHRSDSVIRGIGSVPMPD